MSSRSTDLKNCSSSAKRAATALRSIAADHPFDIADLGVLLAAAKIVDSFAHRKEREAKQVKAEEAKYERDYKAAKAKIEPVVRALPCQTIAEKVVLACLRNHSYSSLVKSLLQPTQREIQWELDYYAQEALSDTISSAAYRVATGKVDAEQAVENIKGKYNEVKDDPVTVSLVGRFVAALNQGRKEAA